MSEVLKVLVVEDIPQDRKLIARAIKTFKEETEIVYAFNVSQALERIEEVEFGLAIVDINLGNDKQSRSGLDVLVKIDKKYPGTKIIVVTIWDNDRNRYLCSQRGARVVISKISLESSLPEAIRSVMEPTFTKPDYTNLRGSFLEEAASLSQERRIALINRIMDMLDITLNQVKESQVDRITIKITADSEPDAQKLLGIIDTFTEACRWIDQTLDPEEISVSRAYQLIADEAVDRYIERLSKSQTIAAIDTVIAERLKIGAQRTQVPLPFEKKAVFSQKIMKVKLSLGRVSLKTEAQAYGRTDLTVSSEDLNQLKKFATPTKGELVHAENLVFQITLINKSRR